MDIIVYFSIRQVPLLFILFIFLSLILYFTYFNIVIVQSDSILHWRDFYRRVIIVVEHPQIDRNFKIDDLNWIYDHLLLIYFYSIIRVGCFIIVA